MITTYSKVMGAAIVGLMNQDCLGFVDDIIFKKENLALYALVLKKRTPFDNHHRIITSADIIEIAENGIAVSSENSVTDLNDNVRIKNALKNGYCGIKQTVITKSGKKIGHVADYYLDTQTYAITKLFVKSMLTERIIPTSAIKNIKGKVITISDDYALEATGSTVFSADAEIA